MFSFAQDTDKWTVEFRLSNDHFLLDEVNNRLSFSQGFGVELLESRSSFGIGIQASKKLNNKFRLGLGIHYNNLRALGQCFCDFCLKFPRIEEEIITFLKIPVFLRYEFFNHAKFSSYTSFGLNPKTHLSLGSIQVEGSFGLGMAYRLNPNYSFNLEAFIIQDLYNSVKVKGNEFRYRGVSLQLGMNRYF